ncbi:hypothetical protein THAOC_25845, partial [Thalassiosira oceanica]
MVHRRTAATGSARMMALFGTEDAGDGNDRGGGCGSSRTTRPWRPLAHRTGHDGEVGRRGEFVPHADGDDALTTALTLDHGYWWLTRRPGRSFVVLPGGVTDSSSSPASLSVCLRTVLDLSDGCAAKEVSFYGDSGLNLLYPADGISDPVKGKWQARSSGSSSTTTYHTGSGLGASG